jgi:hypothetical protein
MRKICFLLLSIIVVLGLVASVQYARAEQDDSNSAKDAILQVQGLMIQAFNETQKLSRKGADVSALKENLTIIQSLTDDSQLAYNAGNFSASLEFSHHAADLANSLIAEIPDLSSQENEHLTITRYTTIASFVLVDVSIAAVGMYVIDRICGYQRAKLFKKRPRTGDDKDR